MLLYVKHEGGPPFRLDSIKRFGLPPIVWTHLKSARMREAVGHADTTTLSTIQRRSLAVGQPDVTASGPVMSGLARQVP